VTCPCAVMIPQKTIDEFVRDHPRLAVVVIAFGFTFAAFSLWMIIAG
jgi:hypothetical protein